MMFCVINQTHSFPLQSPPPPIQILSVIVGSESYNKHFLPPYRGPPSDPLSVVVGSIGPPVGLGFDITEDHVLYRDGKAGNLPGDVGLPAPPGLTQVLQDCPGLVLLNSIRHHVQNVVHHLIKYRMRFSSDNPFQTNVPYSFRV